jgi:hypothetical protein
VLLYRSTPSQLRKTLPEGGAISTTALNILAAKLPILDSIAGTRWRRWRRWGRHRCRCRCRRCRRRTRRLPNPRVLRHHSRQILYNHWSRYVHWGRLCNPRVLNNNWGRCRDRWSRRRGRWGRWGDRNWVWDRRGWYRDRNWVWYNRSRVLNDNPLTVGTRVLLAIRSELRV